MPPPAEESKPVEPVVEEADAKLKGKQVEIESEGDDDDGDDDTAAPEGTAAAQAGSGEASKKKKKKSKRKKVKELLSGKSDDQEATLQKAMGALNPQQIKELLSLNPAFAQEVASASGSANPTPEQTAAQLQKMNIQEIMTGLAASGKNVKDMGAYKFWQTQPVARFTDDATMEEGPIKIQTVDQISKEPAALVEGFEWVTLDLSDDEEIKELYELLNGHYVEDDEAMFRFNYSPSFLRWAMMSPGWDRRYHVGVRAIQSRKLVAYISAIPARIRIRGKEILTSEVNFLCVHKKLRGKRLAPVLIKEITRISNLNGIWQGLHTGGIVLPRPVSTARYYHRSLNWEKLYECGFSPLPANTKPAAMIRKYALPSTTSTKGLRVMEERDLDQVLDLFGRYTAKYDIAAVFTKEELYHWLLPKLESGGEQVVWSYVVEDENKKITDFFSFNNIESSVINNSKHKVIRVAYMFYYGSESGLTQPYDRAAHKARMNELVHDALILAKTEKFDVFNALSLMDNGLFLQQQKFGAGDGQLHYYVFNYRAHPIAGGVDKRNQLDEENLSGIGLVML